MTQTIEVKKLADAPEYQACAVKLKALRVAESDLKAAIRESEEALRADVDAVLPDEKKVARLKTQREDLAATQRAITKQEQTLSSARAEASRVICDSARPRHDEAQRQMAIAIIAANRAALVAEDIRDHLDRGDIATSSLHITLFPEFGMASLDPCSRLSYFVRDCLAHKVLDRTEVPVDCLKRWGV